MAILTQAHHDHFDEYGYMVIADAVPIELCKAVVDAIFDYLEMDPSNPNDWYRAPHKPGAGRNGRSAKFEMYFSLSITIAIGKVQCVISKSFAMLSERIGFTLLPLMLPKRFCPLQMKA